MLLARIVGTVVATRKDPRLVSSKLLLARAVDPAGKPEGRTRDKNKASNKDIIRRRGKRRR